MAIKYYGINDKWTDDDIENVIEIASEDGTVDSVKVNGEDYGGGGGGGLTDSTINLNITIPSEGDAVVINRTCIGIAGQDTGRAYALMKEDRVGQVSYFCYNSNETFNESMSITDIVAIIEEFRITVTQGEITSVAGAAEWLEGQSHVTITGDCTINMTGY